MKKTYIFILLAVIVAIIVIPTKSSSKLVILHTNDLHSQIDPTEDNRGGMLRLKVLVDSVREAEDNVLLVDAGDAVQGTLYYLLYKGDVETMMMNALDYDAITLGNHEFDNGMEMLQKQLSNLNATKISSNYDLSETTLDSLFIPYTIKELEGKRVGIIALNLVPEGMISARNSKGVKYLDAVETANETAEYLKHNLNVDYIIALTHVGYENNSLCDLKIAKETKNIDVIIGGHSHTAIDAQKKDTPTYKVENAVGKTVLIAQTGDCGRYLGEITIDLNSDEITSRLISVDQRLDNRIDAETKEALSPYRHVVDSLMSIIVAKSAKRLERKEAPLINLISDFILNEGETLSRGKVDLAFMNRGGIRNSLPQGNISEGHLMMAFPFDNFVTVLEISGKDLSETFDIIASRNHVSVSDGTEIVIDSLNNNIANVIINGKPLNPNKTYILATIDYLANGGDYLAPLKKAKVIATSKTPLRDDLIRYLSKSNQELNPSDFNRVHTK